MNTENMNSFLKLGYFLNYNPSYTINTSNIDKYKYKELEENDILLYGSKLLKEAISNNFNLNQKHVVPISGGLDSRAILAGLLEHTESKNIYTYTFGTPNTLDFDIGNFVANKLGTNHASFDLTKYKYSQNELDDISKRIDFQTLLFHHAPVWQIDKKYKGCDIWSGFMGDPLAGSKLKKKQSLTKKNTKKEFIKKNTYVASVDLTNGESFDELLICDWIDKNLLSLDEQVDFQNRQLKYIAPHVLMKGYNYRTPFLYQPWMDFILSIDNKYRLNQYLYNKILLFTFPDIFKIKTKNNYGLSLEAGKLQIVGKKIQDRIFYKLGLHKNININYLDFNEEIRNKKELREIIKRNILDLKRKNIIDWINIETILNNHLSSKGNFADALLTLASFEIHLQNGLKI